MTTKLTARDKLLDSANELFYNEGINTVGIDRIIEHAGVAKASLYNAFGSKDELVHAYLDRRYQMMETRISDEVAKHRNPKARILAVFDAQGKLFSSPLYNGCAFARASAEAQPGSNVEEGTIRYRKLIRETFENLCVEAHASRPKDLARELQMIWDGASLSARMDKDPTIAAVAKRAAQRLLEDLL